MSNPYYTHTTYPTPNSPGSSASLRNELENITLGFDLLPTLAANGYKVAMVNSAGTALIASAALQALAITLSTINSTPIGASSPSTGAFTTVSATTFTGSFVGNASTATALATARTIGGTSFDGTANVTSFPAPGAIGGTTPSTGAFTVLSASTSAAVTSSSASAFAVGLTGATNPAFTVDSSTASQVAGLKVTGAATLGTVAVVVTDSGANTSLTVNAKGSGTIGIGSVSTGAVTITPDTTINGAATLASTLAVNGATISTTSATMALLNTGATTVNAFGAATALNVGAATGTLTVANTTLAANAITASTTLNVSGITTLGNGAVLGTPTSMVGTNITGTATAFTASNVTTNANLNGDVTSVGNATTLATVNSNVGAFTNANITVNAKGLITAAASGSPGGVTSVTGTSPVVSSGGTTPAISLASAYGDTLNPYASKTANFVLAAPNGSAGVPGFRAVVAADIPTLNQSTTGSAATLTTGRTISVTGDLAYTSSSFDGSANVTAAGTLATVNANVGSFTAANITVNAKGLITAAANGTAAGASLSNDTSTATDLFPMFASATSGTPTTVFTSNTKLLYKPSTGELKASELVASNGIVVNSQTVSASYTIAVGFSAMSSGPVTISSGQAVTVSSGSRWVVL